MTVETKTLHISVSSLEDFLTCRRLYYYKRLKKYERIQFSVPFLVGRVVHTGLNLVLQKVKDPINQMTKFYREEKKKIKNTLTLTEKQEQDLDEQEGVTQGMLRAYQKRYGAMLRDTTLIASEVEGAVQISDKVIFVIKLDNLIRVRKEKLLHELKTSKYITPEYVQHIQVDRQTAIYFHFYNMIFEESKIEGILYDVIRKPSIRQKKNESRISFLERLGQWYDRPQGDMDVFHVERFKEPKISESSVVNTVVKVSEDMLRCKDKEDYYEDHSKCTSYYGDVCPYYTLCHEGGESKENMVLYQIRKSYHVNKENVLTKG
jgi:hypothetical protein